MLFIRKGWTKTRDFKVPSITSKNQPIKIPGNVVVNSYILSTGESDIPPTWCRIIAFIKTTEGNVNLTLLKTFYIKGSGFSAIGKSESGFEVYGNNPMGSVEIQATVKNNTLLEKGFGFTVSGYEERK